MTFLGQPADVPALFWFFPYSLQHISVRPVYCLLVTRLKSWEERAAHLALTPRNKSLRFQNLWNAIAINQLPRVPSIRQAILCRSNYGRLFGDAAVRRLFGQSYYGRCDPVNVMSGNLKSSQRRYTMWVEIGCKECGKK